MHVRQGIVLIAVGAVSDVMGRGAWGAWGAWGEQKDVRAVLWIMKTGLRHIVYEVGGDGGGGVPLAAALNARKAELSSVQAATSCEVLTM